MAHTALCVQELQSVSSQYINDISGEETEMVQDTLMELTSK